MRSHPINTAALARWKHTLAASKLFQQFPGAPRQLVTNCYQLNFLAFCPGQPVTSCHRLKMPPNPRNLIPPP